MTAEEPNVAPTGRYSVTQTCQVLDISRSTLSRHTEAGRIKFSIRKCNGRKFYMGKHILTYWRAQI